MSLKWTLSALAHYHDAGWRDNPRDWIVIFDGSPCIDGYWRQGSDGVAGAAPDLAVDIAIDPVPITAGQLVNFDSCPEGQPNEVIEYITYVFEGVSEGTDPTLEAYRAALVPATT